MYSIQSQSNFKSATGASYSNTNTNTVQSTHESSANDNMLNYLKFKDFLVEMCMMTEVQASADSSESQLAFEMWEMIAPQKINKSDLIHRAEAAVQNNKREEESKNLEDNDEDDVDVQLDLIYMSELKVQQINIQDLKTIIMAILKINDGKHFVEGE